MHRICTTLLAVFFLTSVSAVSSNCEFEDQCNRNDATAAVGGALLQHQAQLKPATASILQTTGFIELNALPSGAKELFEEKLCKSKHHDGSLNNIEELTKEENSSDIKHESGSFLEDGEAAGISLTDDQWGPTGFESIDAPLNEEGFQKVAALDDEEEMKIFIRRIAESCNMKVTDEGGLNGAVGWFSGKKEDTSLERLKNSLFSALLAASPDRWVSVKNMTRTDGSSAPLDVLGYVQVRSLRSPDEMVKFVKRMIESMGVRIVDKDGFDGLMHFYSKPDDSESYHKLVAEVKKAAYEHTWAELS